MVEHIKARAKKPLLFRAPQQDSKGTFWFESNSFQYAHGFHHYSTAGAVISSAGCTMPRVQVLADVYQLVLQFAVGTRYIAYYIISLQVVGKKLGLDIGLHLNRNASFYQTQN